MHFLEQNIFKFKRMQFFIFNCPKTWLIVVMWWVRHKYNFMQIHYATMFLNQSEQSYHLWYSNIWKLFHDSTKKLSFWHNFDKRIACLFMNVPSIKHCFETFRHNSKIRSNEYEKKLFIRRSQLFRSENFKMMTRWKNKKNVEKLLVF